MAPIELLTPESHRRIPWKNGRGELVVIDREGDEGWQSSGAEWHFGRTAIVEEGPFSDYTGYERLQIVIRGGGLVLVASDHEIDLRLPMLPRRYDGGTPVRTVLEQGPVEVVNLIASRAHFDIDLRTGKAGSEILCRVGRHVVYAPAGLAQVEVKGHVCTLAEDHALRLSNKTETNVTVRAGQVLIGSIHGKQ